MSNKINEQFLNIKEINKRTGEELTLISTSESSVQVVPLMLRKILIRFRSTALRDSRRSLLVVPDLIWTLILKFGLA